MRIIRLFILNATKVGARSERGSRLTSDLQYHQFPPSHRTFTSGAANRIDFARSVLDFKVELC